MKPSCTMDAECAALADACNVGVCVQGECERSPVADGTLCDDGAFCTQADSCNGGACVGTPIECPPSQDVCVVSKCDEVQDTCVTVPAPDFTPCDDGGSCTASDACHAGVCAGIQLVQCTSGDGCCPAGCTSANDSDCSCSENLATAAQPSTSGGGVDPLAGPKKLNDGVGESQCEYCWISNTEVNGAWIEYTWPAPIAIGSIYIETDKWQNPTCGGFTGHGIKSGIVEWWDGTTWKTATGFLGGGDDVQVDIVPPVTTSRLRVAEIMSNSSGYNSRIYEWSVFPIAGCAKP